MKHNKSNNKITKGNKKNNELEEQTTGFISQANSDSLVVDTTTLPHYASSQAIATDAVHSGFGFSFAQQLGLGFGAALAVGGVAAAAGGGGGSSSGGSKQAGVAPVADASDPTATAQNIQIATPELLYIIEEERLARDVYDALYLQTGIKTFDNISDSEQIHYDAVLASAKNLGIDTSSLSTTAGIYSNPELQALYNDLMAMGSKSSQDALKVGALIEQTDIVDLQQSIASNPITSLDTVYSSLLAGSYNHLDAFNSQIII